MAELTLENISKIYADGKRKPDAPKAINNISLTVRDKEFMVIVGPSGCGKSTLLRMIAGLEDIDEGILSIDGKRVNELAPRDRDIAMVFQNYALYPHMTVYDNMAFGLKLKNHSKSEIRQRVIQTAQLLEIEAELDRKPKTLSGGQRQRVAIGRAIIRRPKVFLFDEPLSNLDAKLRSQMRIELQKLHREIKATMIYVTHDQVEAMTLGDRITVLNKGQLMQLDTPMNLYNCPNNKFVAGFIGSPAINFITGSIKEQNGYYFVNESAACRIHLGNHVPASIAAYINKEIQIGVRPENIFVSRENDPAAKPDCMADVIAHENMGNEQLIYLSLADTTIIARSTANELIDMGTRCGLSFTADKIIFLDVNTGNIIEKD